MRNPFKSGTDKAFFWEHAGWSWQPGIETEAQGRKRCAIELAAAERAARDTDMRFRWEQDQDIDSSERRDDVAPYATWNCGAWRVDPADPENEACVSSLCGIDFGPGGEPWGDPYKRVVEAELAIESLETA